MASLVNVEKLVLTGTALWVRHRINVALRESLASQLQTVLEAGGYKVDSAASAAEAMYKMDSQEYSLVLSGRDMGSPDSGRRVLEHAKTMDYRPATAIFDTESDREAGDSRDSEREYVSDRKPVLVAPEDIADLLGKVADLISRRASMQVRRDMRMAG